MLESGGREGPGMEREDKWVEEMQAASRERGDTRLRFMDLLVGSAWPTWLDREGKEHQEGPQIEVEWLEVEVGVEERLLGEEEVVVGVQGEEVAGDWQTQVQVWGKDSTKLIPTMI